MPPADADDYFWVPTDPPYRHKRPDDQRLVLLRAVFVPREAFRRAGGDFDEALGRRSWNGHVATTTPTSTAGAGSPTRRGWTDWNNRSCVWMGLVVASYSVTPFWPGSPGAFDHPRLVLTRCSPPPWVLTMRMHLARPSSSVDRAAAS